MAGLTREGLVIKTQDEVRADYREQASAIFSDLVPAGDVVDTGDESAIGRLIGVVAPATADLWLAVQEVNDAFNPNAARGVSLDNLISLSGITRRAAAPTRASVVFAGDYNTTVSSPTGKVSSSMSKRIYSIASPVILNEVGASGCGVQVSAVLPSTLYQVAYSLDNVNFVEASFTSSSTPTEAEILAGLEASVQSLFGSGFTSSVTGDTLYVSRVDPFQVVEFSTSINMKFAKISKIGIVYDDAVGPFEQPAFSIDTIAIPITGWDSVYNPTKATPGRYTETDEQLRERFRNSKFVQSQNILESILDALLNVEGVADVRIYENDTDAVDSLGVPAHSFLPIVLGGTPTEVAEAIWQNKPIGIQSVGDTVITIYDTQNNQHQIGFDTPDEVPIYVSMNLSSTGDGTLPGDAEQLIRANIMSMAESMQMIGDNVIYSRLYTPINSVPGHMVNSLTIGTAPSPTGTTNITINFDQVASFAPERIIVTIS